MSDRAREEVNQSSVTNQRDDDGSATCDQVDSPAYLFFMMVHSLVFLVGLLLNGFIVKFYFCRAQQKQASSSIRVYLKNLAAADFLLCLCLPIRIANYASSSATIHSVNCNFGTASLFFNMYASIMFMGYIAANRYLKVVRPLGTHILQSVRAAHIISTATWVFLLAWSSAFAILSFRTQKPFSSILMRCEGYYNGRFTWLYKITHTCSTVTFLSVLVSLVFFYYSIFRRVSLVRQRQPASSGSKTLAKSRRNMLVLLSVFCFCFVPYHLVLLPKAFLWRCSWGRFLHYVMEVTIVMSVLNVCLDPLIYFILCKKFRTQLNVKQLFEVKFNGNV
ncbi:P2Y purinoceptor 14-like [Anoplopoma fimbria]|uniref:P2Y purinoceptor 14-like n=1 Tax=Anoplopoma fimbria TaxID=229290 RepID=UPI0023EBC0A4|nr:P2Y purinoceptor 14-like [Anoplopoma fimbria]